MTRLNLAIWYLNLMLFDGPVSAKEMISTGTQLGFSQATLERAKRTIHIKSIPQVNQKGDKIKKWWWTKNS